MRNPAVTYQRDGQIQWFDPVLVTPATLLALSRTADVRASVLATLKRLTPDDYVTYLAGYLEQGCLTFGDAWDYTDLLLLLSATARVAKPRVYLEIGVRRGRSLAMVVAAAPDVAVWGLDMWVPNYAGMDNPGPEFVTAEMRALGHRGPLTLISGDSHETLPALLAAHPDLTFDIVTVDGDHSPAGAMRDLEHVLPRVRSGGVVLFDDVGHPAHQDLAACWRAAVAGDPRYRTETYVGLGYGIAVAVRMERG